MCVCLVVILEALLFQENKTPLKRLRTDFRFEHQRYQLKIYNKSENFKKICPTNNILRVEVKNEKMIKLIEQHNVPVYQDLRTWVAAASALAQWGKTRGK